MEQQNLSGEIEAASAQSLKQDCAADDLMRGLQLLEGANANYQEAAFCLDRAARSGVALAQYKMAFLAVKGKGIRKDLPKASNYLEQLRESGDFETIIAANQAEYEDLMQCLAGRSDGVEVTRSKRWWHRWPTRKGRLHELSASEKWQFDRVWLWTVFGHMALTVLCIEVALWYYQPRPEPVSSQIEIELVSPPQPLPLPTPTIIPAAPPRTAVETVQAQPVNPVQVANRTSIIPSTPSEDSTIKTLEPQDAGAAGGVASSDLTASAITPEIPTEPALDGNAPAEEAFGGTSSNKNQTGWGSYGHGLSNSGSGSGQGGQFARELFSKHDIAVIIDKSASMQMQDCPGGKTRWEWCREQTSDLALLATQCGNPDGLQVTVYSDTMTIYHHATFDTVSSIFRSNSPSGGTRTGLALKNQLDEYHRFGMRPLVIVVITDGVPTDPVEMREAIVAITKQLHSADEVKINILLIGEDLTGCASLTT